MKPGAGRPQIADLRSDIRGTLALGLPLAGMQLAAIAIHLTDTIMVGWLGAFELGAVVLGTQIIFILWIFGGGFANAILPVAATAQGAGDPRGVRRSVRMGIWLLILYGLAASLVLLATDKIYLWLGQDAAVVALAYDYVMIAIWSLVPALVIECRLCTFCTCSFASCEACSMSNAAELKLLPWPSA